MSRSNNLDFQKYQLLQIMATEDGDNSFCVPMVYALLCNTTVGYASEVLGRKRGRGVAPITLFNALQQEGFKATYLQGKNGRGMTRNMPNKLPQGTYVLISNTHVALMVDGEILDWSGLDGMPNKRITSVYRITEM